MVSDLACKPGCRFLHPSNLGLGQTSVLLDYVINIPSDASWGSMGSHVAPRGSSRGTPRGILRLFSLDPTAYHGIPWSSRRTSHGFPWESRGFPLAPMGAHGDFPGSHGNKLNNVSNWRYCVRETLPATLNKSKKTTQSEHQPAFFSVPRFIAP